MTDKIEKYLILIVVLSVLVKVLLLSSNMVMDKLYPREFALNVNLYAKTVGSLLFAPGLLLNIILSFWTYRAAKVSFSRPIGWAVFSLYFGVIGIVFFYIVRVHNMLEEQSKYNKSIQGTS